MMRTWTEEPLHIEIKVYSVRISHFVMCMCDNRSDVNWCYMYLFPKNVPLVDHGVEGGNLFNVVHEAFVVIRWTLQWRENENRYMYCSRRISRLHIHVDHDVRVHLLNMMLSTMSRNSSSSATVSARFSIVCSSSSRFSCSVPSAFPRSFTKPCVHILCAKNGKSLTRNEDS